MAGDGNRFDGDGVLLYELEGTGSGVPNSSVIEQLFQMGVMPRLRLRLRRR